MGVSVSEMRDPWPVVIAFPSSTRAVDTSVVFGALGASIKTRPALGSVSPQRSRKKVLVRVRGREKGGKSGSCGRINCLASAST